MSLQKEQKDGTRNHTHDGLKAIGWVILLLGVLTMAIGWPLTSLSF